MDDAPAEASDASAEASPGPVPFDRAVIDAFADRYAAELAESSSQPEREATLVDNAPAEASDTPAEASPGRAGGAARAADALVEVATRYLDSHRATSSPAQQDRYQLVLHATAETLARDDDTAADGITTDTGIRIHPETGRRLTCDCPTSTLTVDHHDNPLHLGRTRRIRGRVA